MGLRVPAVALLAVVAAGCGSSAGPHVPSGDVAVVGVARISKSSYDALLGRAKALATKRLGALTVAESATLESAVMTRLVDDAEQRNRKNLRAGVEASARIQQDDRVSFTGFLGDGTPRAREIRILLLGRRSVARALYLRAIVGDDRVWCTIGYRSADQGSSHRCGLALITNGELVRPLGRLSFTLPVGHAVLVQASNLYWAVLEPVSTIETGGTRAQVDKLLLLQRRAIDVGAWEARIRKRYCTGVNVGYRNGYQPDPDPTACAPRAQTS